MFADDYQFVAIAIDKMLQGDAVMKELVKGRSGGMPWIAILDGKGEELASSVGPNGNIGCPIQPEEIAHFVDMVKQSSDATDAELSKITDAMNVFADQYRRK